MLWGLLRVGAFRRMGGSVIDRALALERHQVSVGAALERGVRASVTAVSGALGARAADQALTIVYRILFSCSPRRAGWSRCGTRRRAKRTQSAR